MKKGNKPSVRTIAQVVILGVVVFLAFAHQKYGIEKAASIDAYCPFGALESFLTFMTTGEFLKRIYWSSVILLVLFVISNLFLGRIFCSYICPLGALQEWARKLGKVLGFKKDFELPKKYDHFLRYLKYAFLFLAVILSFYSADLFLLNNGPFSALMHFGKEFEEKIIGYSLLILLLGVAVFSKSLWCRYLCPLGAFFGIVNKINLFGIKRDKKTCIDCGLCNRQCPANLNIKEADELREADCISCGNCVKSCPKESLQFRILKKPISKKRFELMIFIFVFLPLLVIPFTPIWKTKVPSNIVSENGLIDAGNIRGSNTLKYLIETSGIPFEEFQAELDLPEDVDRKLKLKDIGPTHNLRNKEGQILETEDFREVIRGAGSHR